MEFPGPAFRELLLYKRTKIMETGKTSAFPYPARKPGGCRFASDNENVNFQEYGEVPVVMAEGDFESWWFFYEDSDKPGMSRVGMDRQNRCILERRYMHGDLSHWTVEKRYFLISRNVMASCLALALIENALERNDYKELIAKLDRLVPLTGDPAKDGCPPLLPPQELLDRKSESEILKEKEEQERQSLDGKVVWEDGERRLYFEGERPILLYKGERYTLGCEPHEPMLIIQGGGYGEVYVHNACYPEDECRGFVQNPHYLFCSITGRHHTAERFCRLLTAAIDSYADCQMDEVEETMWGQLVLEKGIYAIQFEPRDFECDKELYDVLLGTFETALSKKYNIKIHSVAVGYADRNKEEYEYYLLTPAEYEEYMRLPEIRRLKGSDERMGRQCDRWGGKRQVLCNEFRHNPALYKPFFTLDEIPWFNR